MYCCTSIVVDVVGGRLRAHPSSAASKALLYSGGSPWEEAAERVPPTSGAAPSAASTCASARCRSLSTPPTSAGTRPAAPTGRSTAWPCAGCTTRPSTSAGLPFPLADFGRGRDVRKGEL